MAKKKEPKLITNEDWKRGKVLMEKSIRVSEREKDVEILKMLLDMWIEKRPD